MDLRGTGIPDGLPQNVCWYYPWWGILLLDHRADEDHDQVTPTAWASAWPRRYWPQLRRARDGQPQYVDFSNFGSTPGSSGG